MKQFFYMLSTTLCFLLCMACTQADIIVPGPVGKDDVEKGIPLSVKSLGLSVETESRSIVTGGPGNEAGNPNPLTMVGLCVTKANDSIYASGNNTQVFTYNKQVSPAVWKLAEGEKELLLFSEKGTVYAFSPAEKSVSLSGSPKQPLMASVKVLDKQKFYFSDDGTGVDATSDVQWESDQDDYLYCMAATQVDRWNPEVSLEMHHALAKVSFRILEADGGSAFAGSSVKKVVLKSSGGFKKSTGAKLNLATGELSSTMTVVSELSFTAEGEMRAIGTSVKEADAGTVAIQAFGLVIPVTATNVTLELTLDDDRVFKMVSPGVTAGTSSFDVEWKKGANYIYNIKMNPQSIEIGGIDVVDWNDGGATDVPVE